MNRNICLLQAFRPRERARSRRPTSAQVRVAARAPRARRALVSSSDRTHDAQPTLVHDDGRVLVADKPPGLPATGRDRDDHDSLEHLLARHAGRTVWAVHQLDADTSGVIVFVTRKSLVAPWAQRLASHADKQYLAICHAVPAFDVLEVNAPIGPTGNRTPPWWRISRADDEGARAATSRLRVVDRGVKHSLIEVTLVTGRTHQARLHLAHVGHPLVGEKVYRTPPCTEHSRHALHAHAIRFRDGEQPAAFVAPLPADLRTLAARLGLRVPDDA